MIKKPSTSPLLRHGKDFHFKGIFAFHPEGEFSTALKGNLISEMEIQRRRHFCSLHQFN